MSPWSGLILAASPAGNSENAGILAGFEVCRMPPILQGSGVPWGLGWAMQTPGAFASVVLSNPRMMVDHGWRRPDSALYHVTNGAKVGSERMEASRLPSRPALVLWGMRDPSLSGRYAERQREVFPGARIVVLDERGQWPSVDDPETYVD